MKRIFTCALIAVATLTFTGLAKAQTTTDADPDYDLRGRISAGVDKKIVKGLHLTLNEEVRFKDDFGSLDRSYTTLGVDYKINHWMKAGISISEIDKYSSTDKEWTNYQRMCADFTESFRSGEWAFSVRERFQGTHRDGDFNKYQEPRNKAELRTRIQVKYKGLQAPVEPYAFIEPRMVLNAAKWSSDTSFDGYSDVYLNRVRGSFGIDWKLSSASTLNCYTLLDYFNEKDIDANKSGTKLKSTGITNQNGMNFTLGVGYVYSF